LRPKIQIQSLEDLHRHQSFPWAKLSINAPLPSISQTHPTIKLLHRRYSHSQREGEDAFLEGDHEKIGLAIEGGGMRSCVAAGSVLALSHLNLTQYFDVIYGSSAGSMIGAYLISQQVQQASHLYCNLLSSPLRTKTPRSNSSSSSPPSPKFIRTGAIFNELIPETLRASNSTSLLNLDYLLNEIMNRSIYALDWDSFQNNERKQKLSILVSDTQETKSRTLSSDKGNYRTKDELLSCLRASMLVPGVTGRCHL
jgi:predicted acylesterase/phospholipase RssA